MKRIAIIFEASDENLNAPAAQFGNEYHASLSIPFFFPVLANFAQFAKGEELKTDRPSPVKRMYCLTRSRPLDYRTIRNLRHALKRQGYELTMFKEYPPSLYHCSTNENARALKPTRLQPYNRYQRRDGKHAWFQDDLSKYGLLPAVLKLASGSILKNEDGSPRVFHERMSYFEVDDLIAKILGPAIDEYTDTARRAPLWFEHYVDIATDGGAPVEWRAYYYLDRCFYLCPKEPPSKGLSIPAPPSEITSTPPDWGMFCSVDYALDKDGHWWLLSRREGQFSPLPNGASPEAFFQQLAKEIQHGYDYPNWTWCPTGTIVATHKIGKRKVEVPGSRHFPAGRKVYIVDGYFGLGAQRVTVIGVPKYSERFICVDMETDLIENFKVEKVTDDITLRAIYTQRLYEEYPRYRKHIRSCWGNEEQDYEDAEAFVESCNRYYRKTWTEKPGYRSDATQLP